ncbi:MAG: ABC transporter substrate-binding protein [Chloroflexi bacterium]|nr:ABC transporter substrate-binding protein [Chloroflexota bacterium]
MVVEKKVVETVEVVKEVPVEKIIKETVEVVVEKEVVVTATPAPVEQVYYEGFLAGCTALDPLNTTCAHRLDMYVNQPLVAITWQGGLKPLMAESYEMQDDGKIWIFHIRKGVNWHDGTPFTAKDAVFSFNLYANPKVASRWATKVTSILGYADFKAGTADSLAGVSALDDYTLRVELTNASMLWPKLEQIFIVMLPEHILGQVAPEEVATHPYWTQRVGTGPFKWVKYVPEQYIELERNEDYFLGAPKLEKIFLRFYADAATHIAALQSGEIHTTAYETTIIGIDEARLVGNQEGIDVFVMDKGSPAFIRFNHSDPLFADKRVRQAFRYAIDVQTLMDTVYKGSYPAITMFPQAWTWPEGMNTYPYDPDKARELLAEAGWPADKEIDFMYHFKDPLSQDLIVAMQQYLAEVGVKMTPRLSEPANITQAYSDGTFQAGLFGLGMGLDPATAADAVRCESLIAQGYCNPKVDELFAKGLALTDQEERAPVYQEIASILNEEQPSAWLWYDIRPLGFRREAVGPYEHWSEQRIIYFNLPVYNEVETWYIK